MLSLDDLFKGRHFDRDIIILCVRWYLRFKLSFRDLVEMMAERGISLAHTTIMRWIQRYVPEFEKRWNRFARQSQGRLPKKITLDGYQASHRAAREFLKEHQDGARTTIRSSKYLNNIIEQDHRSVKLRLGLMLGFKRFWRASITIAGIELMHRIRKGQFKLGRLRIQDNRVPEIWNAVLAA
ncbi:MAG: IS6 family transposase [Candidatus Acidiferrales bacterium]